MLSFSLPKTCLNSVAFSPDGARLATGGTGGRVKVWTLNPPAVERTFVAPCNDMLRSLMFTADGSFLIRADGKLSAYGPDGVSLGLRPAGVGSEVLHIAPAGARPKLAVAYPSEVVLYGLGDFKPLWRMFTPTPALSLACTPDGQIVALGSRNGTVGVFHGYDGNQLGFWHTGVEIKAVALSPAGDAVAACGHTHLRLWRLTPEVQEVAHAQLGKTHFRAVAWHPGGAFFATANGDGTVDYWDARTGARRESFDWKIGKMHDVTFDAGGDRAACCSLTGKVVVWDVDR